MFFFSGVGSFLQEKLKGSLGDRCYFGFIVLFFLFFVSSFVWGGKGGRGGGSDWKGHV